MLKKLYPYEYADSVFAIDYDKLHSMGYEGLIFDIDNTLVHHGEDSTPEIDDFFQRLHSMGFRTLLLSNNNQARIQRFIRNMDTLYICDGDKPKTPGYLKALRMLELNKEQVVFIGDQLFTDILGANRSGIPNILVKFIRKDPNARIGKRRQVENLILKLYKRNQKAQHRLGDVLRKEG